MMVRVLLFLLLSGHVYAQGIEAYLDLAKIQAQAWQEAQLEVLQKEAYVLKAKASFDPTFRLRDYGKNKGEDLLYRYSDLQAEARIFGGLKVTSQASLSGGPWLNPERQVPASGLVGLGAAIPLGPTLLFDEAQQDLEMARWERKQSLLKREAAAQKVYAEALERYLRWSVQANLVQVYGEAYENLKRQQRLIREGYELGGYARKDTLEAYAVLQTRRSQWIEAQQAEVTSYSEVLAFVGQSMTGATGRQWTPYDVSTVQLGLFSSLSAGLQLPALEAAKMEVEQAKRNRVYERAQQWTMPEVGYFFLQEGEPLNPYGGQWKVTWNLPAFNRKNRAERQLARIWVDQAELDANFAQVHWDAYLVAQQNAVTLYAEKVGVLQRQAQSYEEMLQLERESFALGNSSLFLLNQREVSYLQAVAKRNEAVAEYLKTYGVLALYAPIP
mgnify:FL=1